MTFLTRERSIESGQPVELYEFTFGPDTWRYNDSIDEVVYGPNTYYPRPIQRNDPIIDGDNMAGAELQIELPTTDPVARKFIAIPEAYVMTLRLLRMHRGVHEVWVLWHGRVTGASFKNQGRLCQLQSFPMETLLNRQIPRWRYQTMCNHVLYDKNCKIDPATWSRSRLITEQTGRIIKTVSIGEASLWARGGKLVIGNDPRTIINHQEDSGDSVLTLMAGYGYNVVGRTGVVYAGCDRTVDTCRTKFANVVNYLGFNFVPSKNPLNRV